MNDILKIRLGNVGFKRKPSSKEMALVANHFKRKESSITLSFKDLADKIGEGRCFILAKFKDVYGLTSDLIESHKCLALDIDSKTNPIKMMDMIELIKSKYGITPIIYYQTFSDVNMTKFRLIYRLEDEIDSEVYSLLYEAFVWRFGKYLDAATKNAGRMWCGTDKEVYFNECDCPIDFKLIMTMITSYQNKLKRDKDKKQRQRQNDIKSKNNYINNQDFYILKGKSDEVCEWIINNISLSDFFILKFGCVFSEKYGKFYSSCPLDNHPGDRSNDKAFVIDKNDSRYTCFSHCGTGNIITAAKMIYGDVGFTNLVALLSKDMGFNLKSEWIGEYKK